MAVDTSVLQQWVGHLRAVAGGAEQSTDLPGAGAVGLPLRLANSDQLAAAPVPHPAGDVGLWWAISDESVDVELLIDQPMIETLWPKDMFLAVEVWTESELCGLHALWRLARERGRRDWHDRCVSVRQWHLENTQPDNATNRPWALHVFLLAGDDDGRMYAETLLHNCMAVNGRPDPLSALILIDAARELEVAAGGDESGMV